MSVGIIVLSVIAGVGVVVIFFRLFKFCRRVLQLKAKHEAMVKERCFRAAAAAVTLQSACCLVSLKSLKAMGRLKPHEIAREEELLLGHTRSCRLRAREPDHIFQPSVALVGGARPDRHPTPRDGRSRRDAGPEGGGGGRRHVDFPRLPFDPSGSAHMRVRHQHARRLRVDHALFRRRHAARRAWTRGSCATSRTRGVAGAVWSSGGTCAMGMNNMFFWNDGELHDLADRPDGWAGGGNSSTDEGFSKADWYKDSVMVFSGEYTNEGNKAEMVDVVLGLYAMVIRDQATTKRLFELTQAHLAEVFPREDFEDLPQRLKQLMQYDQSTEGDQFRTILNAENMELSMVKPKTRRERQQGGDGVVDCGCRRGREDGLGASLGSRRRRRLFTNRRLCTATAPTALALRTTTRVMRTRRGWMRCDFAVTRLTLSGVRVGYVVGQVTYAPAPDEREKMEERYHRSVVDSEQEGPAARSPVAASARTRNGQCACGLRFASR